MESDWRVVCIWLLDELVRIYLGEPNNYFCGGGMFLYYSVEQVEAIERSWSAFAKRYESGASNWSRLPAS